MTIQVRISPDLEARLRQQAAAVGQDLETFARSVLEERAESAQGRPAGDPQPPANERVGDWLSWAAGHPSLGYVVDDDRDGIYSGRGV